MRLEGKVAVITGGTSGMGRRMVERFAGEGAMVFFTGRRAAICAEVARLTGATYIKADVTIDADTLHRIAAAAMVNGRIDVLVNIANSPAGASRLEDTPLELST